MRTLHLTSPLMHGPDVLAVQEKLKLLTIPPGPLDGQYGPATAYAVTVFQKRHKLPGTGIADAALQTLLLAAKPPAKPVLPPAGRGVKALAEALKQLGVKEHPAGSNLQPFGAWFGVNGVPWCNIFVSYCFAVGAATTLCKGAKGPGVNAKGCAYVPTTEAWLRSSGKWVGRVAPRPGDIAVYNWDGGVPDHIGIVETYLGGGKFNAIEGNTSVGNDSDGGEVMRRLRYLTQVDGFGRIP